jgi:hypothetical protein
MPKQALSTLKRYSLLLWRRLQPVRHLFPLTKGGVAIVLLAALAFWYEGVTHQDLIVLAATLCCVAAFVVLLLLTLACALILFRRSRETLTNPHHELETGAPVETGFLLRFPSWVPLIECNWIWVDAAGSPLQIAIAPERQSLGWLEVATAKRRGTLESVRRRFTVSDGLGLIAVSWHRTEPVPISIYPSRMDLQQPQQILGLGGGEDEPDPNGQAAGDRVEMRPYVPGDSPRMIMWKVFARSGKLLIRLPEKAVMVHPRGCAYFVSGAEDEPGAAVARAILEKGYLGEHWYFGADGSPEPATTVAGALPILAKSGNCGEPDDESLNNLAGFLDQMSTLGIANALVFIPPTPGPWLDRVQEVLLHHHPMQIQLLAGLDEIPPARVQKPWERYIYRDEAGESKRDRELRRFHAQVSSRSEHLCFVERSGAIHMTLPEPEVQVR